MVVIQNILLHFIDQPTSETCRWPGWDYFKKYKERAKWSLNLTMIESLPNNIVQTLRSRYYDYSWFVWFDDYKDRYFNMRNSNFNLLRSNHKAKICLYHKFTHVFPTGTKNVYELAFINLFLKIACCKFIDLNVVRVILKRFTYR